MKQYTHNLTDDVFTSFISQQEHPLVIIDVWATWCTPCLRIAPIIEEVAEAYLDKVAVGKLDIDKNPTVHNQYDILSIPTLLFFKKGALVKKIVGAGSIERATLDTIIQELLKKE